MNIVIHGREHLVFRDGRPFGDDGMVNGGMVRWPWPSTVAGLVRSRIGFSLAADFFSPEKKEEGAALVKKINVRRISPAWKPAGGSWAYLFPAPADAVVVAADGGQLAIQGFALANPGEGAGVNLPWDNWLVPVSGCREKPAADAPELWFADQFFSWLETGGFQGSVAAARLGVGLPQPETRLHTAINPETGTAAHGSLFASQGIRLATAAIPGRPAGDFGISVELGDIPAGANPVGPAYFGGERRVVEVEELVEPFPPCPDIFAGNRFLRLVLVSPGDFGSWAPDWLRPAPDDGQTPWRQVPESDIKVRLRSAFVPRWQPMSGWDYLAAGPKATRKIVPAGAVYVVELEDPGRARELATLLWGRSMADGLTHPDGCGVVCVGKIDPQTIKE